MAASRESAPRFINRELSWLEFNQRVLDEALDPAAPLLERLKFLAITASNLDEFFMVRVGGLELLLAEGRRDCDPSGLDPRAQLQAIAERASDMVRDQYALFLGDLEKGMAAAGLRRIAAADLTPALYEHIAGIFDREIYPVVTPLALDPEQEFPSIPGLGVNLAVRLRGEGDDPRKARFAVVPIPRKLGRFVTLPVEEGHNYMLIEEIAGAFVQRLFPGEPIAEWVPFRITRNADLRVQDEASDLLEQMTEILDARRLSGCVRLEIAGGASKTLLGHLRQRLGLRDEFVHAVPGPLDLAAFMGLSRMPGFDALRDKPWPPQASPAVDSEAPVFESIRRGDLLLYHPYDSFDPVARLLEEAAADPAVLAIKQILYRTSEKSPIVAALARAAGRDKHVTALVELKARFDEARNIGWAEELEQSGVQVIWGLRGLKTHAKICIIVRREAEGIRRYVHFGTGNYNEITARLYSDISYMTCQEDYGADATAFFNAISGYSQPPAFRKIAAAPLGLRARLAELIESEIQRCQDGQEARIMAKVNSLADQELIELLYRASQAGVKIQLSVRGVCCLRPGVKGLSENIRVVSVVDRFLEHARILYFHQGGDPQVFISSADWMSRNLDRRVELMVPIDDAACRKRLVGILETGLRDTVKGRVLGSDGRYTPQKPSGSAALRSQEAFYEESCRAVRKARKAAAAVFEPQRPGEAR